MPRGKGVMWRVCRHTLASFWGVCRSLIVILSKGSHQPLPLSKRWILETRRAPSVFPPNFYDYLRMLFSVWVRPTPLFLANWWKSTSEDVLSYIHSFPEGTRIAILTEIVLPEGRTFDQQLDVLIKGGYSDWRRRQIFPNCRCESQWAGWCWFVSVAHRPCGCDERQGGRYAYIGLFAEPAFYEGREECVIQVECLMEAFEQIFSKRFEADGIPISRAICICMFNFNNPIGACPKCEGFGKVVGIDENLVVPNKTLSVYERCSDVLAWSGDERMEKEIYSCRLLLSISRFTGKLLPTGSKSRKIYFGTVSTDSPRHWRILWMGEKQSQTISSIVWCSLAIVARPLAQCVAQEIEAGRLRTWKWVENHSRPRGYVGVWLGGMVQAHTARRFRANRWQNDYLRKSIIACRIWTKWAWVISRSTVCRRRCRVARVSVLIWLHRWAVRLWAVCIFRWAKYWLALTRHCASN